MLIMLISTICYCVKIVASGKREVCVLRWDTGVFLSMYVDIQCLINLVYCPGQNKRIALLPFFLGCRKRRQKD
jgi:hypothetical protein